MATLIQCDGDCNKVSPTKEGKHIANDWVKVHAEGRRLRMSPADYVFCESCAPVMGRFICLPES